ncbi:hypothetical protein LJB42_003240 [Komagataella kurtzmanii]|nr:hypothetical protein LJB42_003240 [Komagataella kurtzmanii]
MNDWEEFYQEIQSDAARFTSLNQGILLDNSSPFDQMYEASCKDIDDDQMVELLKVDYLILNYLIIQGHVKTIKSVCKRLNLQVEDLLETCYPQPVDLKGDDCFSADQLIANYRKSQELCDKFRFKVEKSKLNILTLENVTKLSLGLATINIRNNIKQNILKGNIDEAVSLLGQHYPMLFETNQYIYFRLLHLQLIETFRRHVEGGKENSSATTDKEFLDNFIHFIKQKLVTIKILQNESFIKDIELTMALLCYKDQLASHNASLPTPLQKIYDIKLRRQIALLVNTSILVFTNEGLNEPVFVELKLPNFIKIWNWINGELKAL